MGVARSNLEVACCAWPSLTRNVSNHGLIGKLPPEIGDLVNLEVLDVGNIGGDRGKNMTTKNQFEGPLPESLAKLTNLKALYDFFHSSEADVCCNYYACSLQFMNLLSHPH